jgi:uncharacterized membrane protein
MNNPYRQDMTPPRPRRVVFCSLLKFFLPVLLGLGAMGLTGLLLGPQRMQYWPLMTGYFFPPLGKETIIPLGIHLGFHPALMALSIAFIDIIVALFLLWNYDLAKTIPVVGTFMRKVEEKGRGIEDRYGWIKPLRFFGIVLFVMVPFQGSGGLVGSIVGRLIGMKPLNTFLAINVGALLGCFLIAYFAKSLQFVFLQNFLGGLFIIVILIIIGVIVVSIRKNNRKKKTTFIPRTGKQT